MKLHGRLLWSPANTGPVFVARQVVTIHDATTLDYPQWFTGSFARWYRLMLPMLVQHSRKIITVSEFSKKRLLDHCKVNEEKIAVIYNGIGSCFAPAAADLLSELRAKYRLEKPFVLYVGSLEPRKNLRVLLEAWKLLKLSDYQLVIAGATGHVFRDQGFEVLPDGALLIGQVSESDLPALYSAAALLVYPSIYEGFGLPMLEAMACGCPVIASNTTSLPEVGGQAVLYFDPVSPEDLMEKIRWVMELKMETRTRLVREGLSHAQSFTWEKSATKTRQVLEAVMP